MRNTLICTVGTSLKKNLTNSAENKYAALLEQKNIKGISLELAKIEPTDHLVGAEINSIASILKKNLIQDRLNLHLLVSDTEDGRLIGEILKAYYERRQNPLFFEKVHVQVITGLTDQSTHLFRTEGLRNLVKEIAEIVRRHGSENILINATGGYKAQISFAGMIGQSLEIPVCYLFERFSEVIELPPQPVSLDLTFWLNHSTLFFELAADEAENNPVGIDPRFESLVDEIEMNGEKVIGLSPTGQLFHETFQYRFQKQRDMLLPPDSGLTFEQKKISFEDSNAGKHAGLKTYLDRIGRIPYVVRIFTYYYNPDLPTKNYFRPSSKGGFSHVEGGYSEGKAMTKFDIVTTAKNKDQSDATIADLSSLFI